MKITVFELLLVQKVTLSQEAHIDLKASILGKPARVCTVHITHLNKHGLKTKDQIR